MTPTDHLARSLEAVSHALKQVPGLTDLYVTCAVEFDQAHIFIGIKPGRFTDADEALRRSQVVGLARALALPAPTEQEPWQGRATYQAEGSVGHSSCTVAVHTPVRISVKAVSA